MDWHQLLPKIDKDYTGPTIPFYFLVVIAAASTVRSLIHIFAPDGGAHSIAGIDIDVEGGRNLVAMFAQWGGSQLLMALLYWVVIVRYRWLTPLMLAVVMLEQFMRLGCGTLKPLEVTAAPPGGIITKFLLPICVVMFLWSLRAARSGPESAPRRSWQIAGNVGSNVETARPRNEGGFCRFMASSRSFFGRNYGHR
jgi:hypothetical protein